MIKAILLDLGKVIVPFDFSIGYRAFEARSGLSVETIRERIRNTGLVPRLETGLIEPVDFVEQLCNGLGVDIKYPEFCEIWSSIFSRQTLIPDCFLNELHVGHRLVLVSNTNAIHFEMIRENYPLLRHFDALILSYEVQAMKPSPVIFEAAINAAGCPAAECFFTDDIPDYVEAARLAGIDAVVFQDYNQLQRDLRERGVKWNDAECL
jgi:putative hydrolase of the HAD superfamily